MRIPTARRLRARLAAVRADLASPARRRRRREDLVTPLTAIAAALFVVVALLSWGLLYVADEALDNTYRLDRAEKCDRALASLFRQATNRNGAIIYVVLDGVDRERHNGEPLDFDELADLPQLQPAPVDCRDRTVKIADPIRFRDLPPQSLDALEDRELRDLLRRHKARSDE